jgi:quercetin dioxygenase-like cupin family protein
MSQQPLIDAQECRVLNLPAEARFVPNGIVSRTLLQIPGSRVVLFSFTAGQELTEHTSPHHAVVQVLSGECEFKLGDQSRRLVAGDLVHMPPQLPHAVRATQDFSMLLTLLKATTAANDQAETPRG